MPERRATFSDGPDQAATSRDGAHLIAKPLDGARPGNLPIEQMDALEVVVNLKVV